MPNVTASFDDAFNDGPKRKGAQRKRRAASGKRAERNGKRGPALREHLQKVARYGAIGMSAIVALAIMCNALIMQKGRHPAPLFGKSFMQGSNTISTLAARTPVPRPLPTAAEASVSAAADVAPPPKVAKHDLPAEPSTHDASTAVDPIGRLLRDGAIVGAEATSDTKEVLGAQRALVKLGFVLKPSGTLGPRTKKAIERFEKDRHLPIKGELTPRLVKILAAESGIRID